MRFWIMQTDFYYSVGPDNFDALGPFEFEEIARQAGVYTNIAKVISRNVAGYIINGHLVEEVITPKVAL